MSAFEDAILTSKCGETLSACQFDVHVCDIAREVLKFGKEHITRFFLKTQLHDGKKKSQVYI